MFNRLQPPQAVFLPAAFDIWDWPGAILQLIKTAFKGSGSF
jgi:hypothetical protein